MHEHGPHAVVLGPDGLIYLMIGNHTRLALRPRNGVRIITGTKATWYSRATRMPADTRWASRRRRRRVAQPTPREALCKPSPAASATLMTWPSISKAIYSPSIPIWNGTKVSRGTGPRAVNHIIPGGEFGWRSGWANWPEYFYDGLPATLNVGRGSPTGMVVYNHYMMPALSQRAVRLRLVAGPNSGDQDRPPHAARTRRRAEVFLEGRPLNVTDVEVGPDGWLYFCTGGRGTDGGIYRVVWTGKVPPRPAMPGAVEADLSAAARQRLGSAKGGHDSAKAADPKWDRELLGIAENVKNKPDDRGRALDLMQLLGPFPTADLLVKLSRDRSPGPAGQGRVLDGLHADEKTAPHWSRC